MAEDALDLTALDPGNNEGYGTRPLPCARDEEVSALVGTLSAPGAGAAARQEHATVLLAFAERMATLARRERSPDRLRAGLAAAGLASGVAADQREALTVLPLLWRTADVLELDTEAEFRSTADRLGASQGLLDFIGRHPGDRTIESMGYVEVDDETGFSYQRTW